MDFTAIIETMTVDGFYAWYNELSEEMKDNVSTWYTDLVSVTASYSESMTMGEVFGHEHIYAKIWKEFFSGDCTLFDF